MKKTTQIVTKETRYFMLVCFCIYSIVRCSFASASQCVREHNDALARERADFVWSSANVILLKSGPCKNKPVAERTPSSHIKEIVQANREEVKVIMHIL